MDALVERTLAWMVSLDPAGFEVQTSTPTLPLHVVGAKFFVLSRALSVSMHAARVFADLQPM